MREVNGNLTYRSIANRTNGMVSHTSVGDLFNGKRILKWSKSQAVIRALDGDPDEFRKAWEEAFVEKRYSVAYDVTRTDHQINTILAEIRAVREMLERGGAEGVVFTTAREPVNLTGRFVQLARERMGDLTQGQFAELFGMTRTSYNRIERGFRQMPSEKLLHILIAADLLSDPDKL